MSRPRDLSIDIKSAAPAPGSADRNSLPVPASLSRSTSGASGSDEPLTPTPPSDITGSGSESVSSSVSRPLLRPTPPAGPPPLHAQPHFVDMPSDTHSLGSSNGGGGASAYFDSDAISAAAAAGVLNDSAAGPNDRVRRVPMQLEGADCCGCVSNPRSVVLCGGIRMCSCWTQLPFEFRVLIIQIITLGLSLLGLTLALLFEITSVAVVCTVLAVFIVLTIVVHRVMLRARMHHRNQRYHALPQHNHPSGGAAYRQGAGLHPLALRHMQQSNQMPFPTHTSAFAASAAAATGIGGAMYEDLLAATISQNAYALDPETLSQLALVNPRLGRHLSGSTHMRLSMLDREFTPNDYETLCSLDEESRQRSGPITGIPQSQIERMPVLIVQPPALVKQTSTGTAAATAASTTATTAADTATAASATAVAAPIASASASTNSSGIVITPAVDTTAASTAPAPAVEAHKCAICLEATQPGDALRVLLCMHRFHVDCVDRWLRRKAVCPTCKFDLKKL